MKSAYSIYKKTLEEIKENNLYKVERVITSKQGRLLKLDDGSESINFCANNYLGFGGSQIMINNAKKGLEQFGYGMNSVRFICGTQSIHTQLEKNISGFLHCEDSILYSSCFDANAGLFETLLTKEDVIISDKLNHASIIDGVRLCKADRKVYQNGDMSDLKKQLEESKSHRIRLIATDGVFSMDGTIAPLKEIVTLAKEYDALVMVDESHATGVIGDTGRGAIEAQGVLGEVDIITGTFGKALGGASGGFTCSKKEIVDMLRQRSRPYLFSNSLAPSIAYAQNELLNHLKNNPEIVSDLQDKTLFLRKGLKALGYEIPESTHPIVPVMLYEEQKALEGAQQLKDNGIYAIGFCYPVVPKGQARIRLQVNAIHTQEDLERCLDAFKKIKSN
jgi:glycine C-acetyltransferase